MERLNQPHRGSKRQVECGWQVGSRGPEAPRGLIRTLKEIQLKRWQKKNHLVTFPELRTTTSRKEDLVRKHAFMLRIVLRAKRTHRDWTGNTDRKGSQTCGYAAFTSACVTHIYCCCGVWYSTCIYRDYSPHHWPSSEIPNYKPFLHSFHHFVDSLANGA